MSILSATNITYSIGDRTILKDATFRLLKGEHIGLVGANGEGKSTFINLLLGHLTVDSGTIEWAKHTKVGYLDQFTKLEKGKTIKDILKTAFDDFYKMEEDINNGYMKMAEITDENEMNDLLEEIGEMQAILDSSGFYLIDSKIEETARGLGLYEIGLDKDVSELSGGQRAKVLLTKLLLENPQILILDEPTNFLDVNHISWLRNYLLNFENAFILVSHDTEFMNAVTNVIYAMDNTKLTRYTGNYESFMEAFMMKKKQVEDAYNAQQKEIAKMEDFIARNKARVATRGMANSRQKQLDKMVLIDKGVEHKKANFIFRYSHPTGTLAFETDNLVIGYDRALTKPINLAVKKGEKIAIVGINGVGKSTLVKTLIGVIKPFSGKAIMSPTVDLGYFEQEVKSDLITPFNYILEEFRTLNNGEIFAALSNSGIKRDLADNPMMTLSGGEQAKVRMCKLTIKETNVIVLDEPTNHLDVASKESLHDAIKNYPGNILLVCHEPEFYKDLVDRVINVEDFRL